MKATIQKIKNELKNLYPEEEVRGFIRIIFSHFLNISLKQIILMPDYPIDAPLKRMIDEVVARLQKYEPIQYILEETEFYNLKLKVSPWVLIPRPETEELVEWILHSPLPDSPSVIDIGTGSGCIALALKKNLPGAVVFALDVSEKAVETAAHNANTLGLDISFMIQDIFRFPDFSHHFDLIVSNPPYIRNSEKIVMHRNVTDYEPHEALFVPDHDPLMFYKAIMAFSFRFLKKGGAIYLEINEAMGNDMSTLFSENRFSSLEIKKDLNGRDRMFRCIKDF